MIFLLFHIISSTDLYNQANAAYESGNYYQAIELYQEAARDVLNPDVCYNLGNAFFKTGQTGKAIKQYRIAYFLSPRDNDVRHNLLYTRTYRVDKTNININPLEFIFDRIFHFISLYEAQILSGIIILIIAILIAMYIVFRLKLYLYISTAMGVLILFCMITWATWSTDRNHRPVVIITPEAAALSGPADDYREIVKVHDGTEANIRDERNGYYLIQLPGGIGGWVKKDAVEEIF